MEKWQQSGVYLASFALGIVVLAACFLPQHHSQLYHTCIRNSSLYIVILNSGAWCMALGANIYIKQHSAINNMRSFCTATTKKNVDWLIQAVFEHRC